MSEPILLTTDAPSLLFEDPKQQAQFELGVSSAVFLWDDMATAVANGWGGPDSEAKREWTAASVVELFEANEVGSDDIEYRLLSIMEDEFDVVVETGTALQVAEHVVKVYQDCAAQDYRFVTELYERFSRRQNTAIAPVQVQGDDGDEDDDDDEGEEEEAAEAPQLMDVDEPAPQEPEVDEDGFRVVTRKNRR